MINKERGKWLAKNSMRENRTDKLRIPRSFFNRLTQKVSTRVGAAAISALIALHFISQFIFFQNEPVQIEDNFLKPQNEQVVEITPELATTTPPVVSAPEVHKTIVQPVRKAAPLVQKTVKKKQIRETRAERLRRAEKLLTGV